MQKFPSIDQYRHVIRNVRHRATCIGKDEDGSFRYDPLAKIPTLQYQGTVKLHGTNAGIAYDIKTDELTYQSRERVLSLTSDNAGFMLYMSQPEIVELVKAHARRVFGYAAYESARQVVIFGEWCGSGIQKGVAISELPKMFVVFGIKVVYDTHANWITSQEFYLYSHQYNIYSIYDFPAYTIEIDFNNPEYAQMEMIKITEAVEAECPVGKAFDVSGVGEGVVWKCTTPGWESSDYWFKVKGEKHSASKVKTLAPVDIESLKAMNDFVAYAVTESRLEQGLDYVLRELGKPFEMASLGDFIRWVYNDVVKEETDTIVENQFEPKKLGGPISKAAKDWYISKLNAEFELAA